MTPTSRNALHAKEENPKAEESRKKFMPGQGYRSAPTTRRGRLFSTRALRAAGYIIDVGFEDALLSPALGDEPTVYHFEDTTSRVLSQAKSREALDEYRVLT
eukprot:scaffold224807_cov40-Prasinocladus_malaysianus.AAC.2